MAMSIKDVNTDTIRQKNEFVAMALKIEGPRNKESLFFLPPPGLKGLLIALENRLYATSQLNKDKRIRYGKTCDKASKRMHENIPSTQEDKLKNADINRRVNSLMPVDDKGENLALSLTLHDGQTCELLVNGLQIQVLVHTIIHAINSAGMRELALQITSLLDLLPLYDVGCQQNDNLEYDSYTQPEWRRNLFNHYLAIIYRYTDNKGKAQFCGSVVKTRTLSNSKKAEATTRRLLGFNPRLKKLADIPCQVFVRMLMGGKAQKLDQGQCLHALHHLRVQSAHKTQNA